MYETLGHIETVFKLIGHRKKEPTARNIQERLLTTLKLFLFENTVYPVCFWFEGKDVFDELRGQVRDDRF